MKKYLINGLLALVAGGFAASCADHDVDYVPIEKRKTQAYEAAFKELIGGEVSPNQNWGFTGTSVSELEAEEAPARAQTRADLDGGYSIIPDNDANWQDFTYFSKEKMNEIINQKLPEGINAGGQLNDYEFVSKGEITFSFVYATTSGQDEIGYYYYNPSDGINSKQSRKLIDNIQEIDDPGSNKHLFQYSKSSTEWIIPSVAPSNNDCATLFNSGQIQEVRGKTVTLRIPVGYRFGFYIVNPDFPTTMYSNKSLNSDGRYYSAVATLSDGTFAVGLEDWYGGDYDCNDIVLTINKTNLPEIVNYNKTTKKHYKHKRIMAQGRVFCEDLGTAGLEDLDFNDVVFDARIWRTYEFDRINDGDMENKTAYKYEVDICMLAGGGTIPAKLLYEYNIHDLFEGTPGMTTMVNTVDDDHANVTVIWDNMKANPGHKTYREIDITDLINSFGENHEITLNDIPISVLWASSEDPTEFGSGMQTVGDLRAEPGKVPHKFCLPIGTKWPAERRKFTDAYSGFDAWAKGETDDDSFCQSPNTAYIYSDTGYDAKLDLYDVNGTEYYVGYTTDIKLSQSTTEVTETETVVWAHAGMYLNDYPENHLIYENLFAKMEDNQPDNTYTIRIYGTKNADAGNNYGAQLLTGQYKHIVDVYHAVRNDSYFDTKGYIEYTNISNDLVSALKYDKGNNNGVDWWIDLQGKNFTATKISFVRTVVNNY